MSEEEVIEYVEEGEEGEEVIEYVEEGEDGEIIEYVEEGEEGEEVIEYVEEGDEGGEVVEEVVEYVDEGDEGGEVVEVVEEVVVEGDEGGEGEVVEEVVEEVVQEPEPVKQKPSSGPVIHKTKRTGKKIRRSGKVKWENPEEVTRLISEVLHNESYSGWVLVGYQDDNLTLEIQAHGQGGVSEFLPLLQDDQYQYVLVRIQDSSKGINTGGAMSQTTRDVLITWQGQKISILQRGRFNEHKQAVKQVMKPCHADLVAKGKTNFDDEEVRAKSAPLSGSHEIE